MSISGRKADPLEGTYKVRVEDGDDISHIHVASENMYHDYMSAEKAFEAFLNDKVESLKMNIESLEDLIVYSAVNSIEESEAVRRVIKEVSKDLGCDVSGYEPFCLKDNDCIN